MKSNSLSFTKNHRNSVNNINNKIDINKDKSGSLNFNETSNESKKK